MINLDQHQPITDIWTRWVYPSMSSYLMQCCDCGVIHEFEFAVDEEGLVKFRVRRKIDANK